MVKISNDEKKISGTVEKQDFFLKQINPVNLKKFFCTTIFEVSSCEQNFKSISRKDSIDAVKMC